MDQYLGKDTGKLGFGLMRLPRNEDGSINIEECCRMTDLFMEAGMTYFDTAYVYGGSEEAARQFLVERYPRDRYTLASKLCAWQGCHDEESAKKQLETSLARTGAEYFDYYLLHALQAENYKKYDEYHLWDFVKEQKEKGLIRHWGFSFHADAELLDRLLTEHPDAEFVQLQLNYADWESPAVASRACYETALRHGVPIVVMEPVKGGTLASPPGSVGKILKEADPKASAASWAIRFAASLDNILTVLSGMSSEEQMRDNLSFMRDFRPLDEKELGVIRAAQKALRSVDSIPCTGCGYCAAGCPQSIPIPDIFSAMNWKLIYQDEEKARRNYSIDTRGAGTASDCVQCMQCESACPQQIPVTKRLAQCAAFFDAPRA